MASIMVCGSRKVVSNRLPRPLLSEENRIDEAGRKRSNATGLSLGGNKSKAWLQFSMSRSPF